jgi:hypothetical protein
MSDEDEEYKAAMAEQFQQRSKEPLLTDSVSRQIIQRLDEIARLIPQHRFFSANEFAGPTLDGLSEIAKNGVRYTGDLAYICQFMTTALVALASDMDTPPAGTG